VTVLAEVDLCREEGRGRRQLLAIAIAFCQPAKTAAAASTMWRRNLAWHVTKQLPSDLIVTIRPLTHQDIPYNQLFHELLPVSLMCTEPILPSTLSSR
jgi:hypothetical protein